MRIRKAFVMMPFSPPVDSYYKAVFRPALENAEYSVERADDLFAPRPIMLDVQELILSADLVLCEMSGRSPNVFYELGLAHAVGKPAILVSSKEEDIPFDLRHVRIILYDTSEAGWEDKLRINIERAAREVVESKRIWPLPLTKKKEERALELGFQILSPQREDVRIGRFEVSGSFEVEPSSGVVKLFIVSPDNTQYWPQDEVVLDLENNTWKGYAALYDKPPREAFIVVAKLGECGKILCDYYTRVGHETEKYFPLSQFPEDIQELDRVKIFKVKP